MPDFNCYPLDELVDQFHKLPGIGRKTAQRLALFIIREPQQTALALANAIENAKKNIKLCKRCFNIAESDFCTICLDQRRESRTICVVEDVVDIFAIEKSNEFKGLYHVLGGVISPLAGKGPDDIRINELTDRIEKENIKEILLALNPSTEGEATMIYLSKIFKNYPVRITRIASGIPFGSHLEFIDNATIGRAILSRRDFEDF